MTEIPIIDDSTPEELRCTVCLLPMQYQTKKEWKVFVAMFQVWKTIPCI